MTALARNPAFEPAATATRLQDRLRMLAGEVPRKAPAGLSAVLGRIDETILPRALTLGTSDGGSLRLLVSNRRLMRVETARETTAGDDAPADPEAAAALFARRLQPILGDGQSVSISSARYPADAFFWNVGCSAGLLARAMGACACEAASPTLEALLDRHALAQAEVSGAGQVLSRSVSATAKPALEALLALVPGRSEAARICPPAQAGCTFLPAGKALDAMIATGENGTTLAIVPTSLRDRLITAWKASLRH